MDTVNFDAPRRPQRVGISWVMETPRDERDEGFWPSKDPAAAGYTPPEIYETEMRRARGRMAAWKADRWHYVGVIAAAHISIPIGGGSFVHHTVRSAGLWGIESNSGAKYLREVFADQKAELLAQLRAFGAALQASDFDEESE